MRKIAKNLGIALLVFIVVVGVGLTGWYYSKGWRAGKSGQYLTNSEKYLETKNGQALWELEKAYLVGMDYSEYRIRRAIAMIRLSDQNAVSETEFLLKNGWVNDKLLFWYGKYLFDRGDFESAEKNILMIGTNLPQEYMTEYNELMAFWAGKHANWQNVADYLGMILKSDSELTNHMKIASAVLEEDQTKLAEAEINQELAEKIENLEEVNGDLYVLGIAEIMNDLKLTYWARALMDGNSWESVENKDLFLVYGRSYLIDGNCGEAWRYFQEAKKEDVVDEGIDDFLVEMDGCKNKYQVSSIK